MRCSRYLCFVALVGSMGCEPELGVITCPDGTVCPADLSCPAEPGGPCVADGCRGRAPGDDCRPEIGDVGGACNADGVCVPFSCGDGDVQALEACDPTAPLETCGDLDFDYGRRSCTADCRAIVSTCDFIDDRDLGLDLETVAINAVAISEGEVWAAGSNGVYRRIDRAWEKMLDDAWLLLQVIGPDDLWALGEQSAAHWDGMTWTVEAWPYGTPTAVMASNGQLAVGVSDGSLIRRVGIGWDKIIVRPVPGPITALARLGNSEVVAYGGVFSPPSSFRTLLYTNTTSGWEQIPFPGQISKVRSLVGDSLDDYIASGEDGTQFVEFKTRRVITNGTSLTIEPIPGSGWITPVAGGLLILPVDHPQWQPDPVVAGTFYRDGVAHRVSIPGRVRLVTSEENRVIIAVGTRVLELGGTLRAPAFTVQSATPVITGLSVAQLSSGPSGDVYALDARGLVWRGLDIATTVPRAVEQVRNLANTIAVWGTGSEFMTITSDRVTRYDAGMSLGSDALADQVARAVTGNASDDVMVVGEGDVPARHFDGAAWTPASDGLPANAKLRAIAATGSGFVAVGDGGLVATFAAGTWTVRDVGTTANLELVASAGESLVATGAGVAVRCDATTCVQDSLPWTPTDLSMRAGDDIVAVGSDKTLHFDGVAWNRVDLDGAAPAQVLVQDNVLVFGERGAAGRIQQLVRMRPWR